jgi:hypothetical protein
MIGGEAVRYGVVTPVSGNTYTLSHFLRGQRGTDAFWNTHRAGETVVFGDGSVRRVDLPADLSGSRIQLKLVGDGQSLDDVSAVSLTIHGRELLAWSPVNLAGSRDGGNNLTISWTRRARQNNGLLNFQGLPLDFAAEAYKVSVLSDTATAITAVTQAQQTVVTAAGHGLAIDDEVYLSGLLGMLYANNQIATVVAVDGDDVTLSLDTRDYPAYSSAGTLRKVVHVINAATDTAAYSAANQTSDGFTPGDPIDVSVAQIGDDGRRGYLTTATL